jgi:hypothetical protein
LNHPGASVTVYGMLCRLALALVWSLALSAWAVGVLAVSGGSATAGSSITPSRMVLQVSDLPSGFVVVRKETGPKTNGELIREHGRAFAKKLRRWGRITGFNALYRQRDPSRGKLPGVFDFGASVALWRTAQGAHAALADPSLGCRHTGFTIIGLAGHRPVGPDTLVCTTSNRIKGARLRTFVIQWRNHRATGVVFVVAVEGAVTAQAALTGGYRQNRRMAAQLRRGNG